MKDSVVNEESVEGFNLVFVSGAPGAGKGYILQQIIPEILPKFRICSISAEIKRRISNKMIPKDQLKLVNLGEPVDDEYIFTIVEDFILSHVPEAGTLFIDGFPRTESQAIQVEEWFGLRPENVKLLHATAEENICKNACLGRNRGPDDNELIFEKRWENYIDEVRPSIDRCSEILLTHTVRRDSLDIQALRILSVLRMLVSWGLIPENFDQSERFIQNDKRLIDFWEAINSQHPRLVS